MATSENTNPRLSAKLSSSSRGSVHQIDPLERVLPAPDSIDEALRRDLFLWPGTAENIALAELANIERQGDKGIVTEAMRGLEASVMYQRLSDESYRTQDADSSKNHSQVLMHARLFAAGRLAERRERFERRERKRKAAHF
jgi:hypothetical protein